MRSFVASALAFSFTLTAPSHAALIMFDGTGGAWEVSHYVGHVQQNSVGRFPGKNLSIGVIGVYPNGKGENAGVVVGDPTTAVARQAQTTIELRNAGNTLNPNAFGGGLALTDATKSLTGAWEVQLANPGDPGFKPFFTPSICDSVRNPNCAEELLPERASGVMVSFSSGNTTPTFSWDLLEPVDRVSVSYYDLDRRDSLGRADRIASIGLTGDAESFTIPEGWKLSEDGAYSFRIDTRVSRSVEEGTATAVEDGGDTPSGFSAAGAALAETIAFYDFAPSLAEYGDEIYLPVEIEINPDGNPVFNFDHSVLAGRTYNFDPIVAIGYDYQTNDGNPNFSSFTLPDIGDGLFDLYLWDGIEYVFESMVEKGLEILFDEGGVDRFRILGIETDSALDPFDTTAFVTGLSFVSDGRFTGTMTPSPPKLAQQLQSRCRHPYQC